VRTRRYRLAAKKGNSRNGGKQIDTVWRKDKRQNMPAEELRDFAGQDEQQPAKVLYPRDPVLDPQLL
jgi:hypothetical protein